jgi:hypothetical protein
MSANDLYNDGFDAGRRDARRELKPFAEAVRDAVYMFEQIAAARQLPATAQATQQYVAMGKQLRRLLDLSGLDPVELSGLKQEGEQ